MLRGSTQPHPLLHVRRVRLDQSQRLSHAQAPHHAPGVKRGVSQLHQLLHVRRVHLDQSQRLWHAQAPPRAQNAELVSFHSSLCHLVNGVRRGPSHHLGLQTAQRVVDHVAGFTLTILTSPLLAVTHSGWLAKTRARVSSAQLEGNPAQIEVIAMLASLAWQVRMASDA